MHRLRQVLPEGAVVTVGGRVGLGPGISLSSESGRLTEMLSQAARLQGAERLRATLASLEPTRRGSYLPDVDSQWARQRRDYVADLVTSARFEAAELAFATANYGLAQALCDEVVADDPFREAAWRLRIQVADALGDGDAALAAYRECQLTLAGIGIEPSVATASLLRSVRR
jgi:DNA-binding SARP family transcriptional activator